MIDGGQIARHMYSVAVCALPVYGETKFDKQLFNG